jgi:hypothetical protein
MPKPPGPQSKPVKMKDGRTATVRTSPTLEEYRAQEARDAQAPTKRQARGAEGEQPPSRELTPLEEAQALLRPKSKLIRSNPANLPKATCSICGRRAHEHPVRTVRDGMPFHCSTIYVRAGDWRDDEPRHRPTIPGPGHPETEEEERERLDQEYRVLLADFRAKVADKPRSRPRRPDRRRAS